MTGPRSPGGTGPPTPAPQADPRFLNSFNAAPFSVLLVDGEGRVTFANGRAAEVFGAQDRGMVGRPVDEFLPPADDQAREEAAQARSQLLSGRASVVPAVEVLARRDDGQRFPVEVYLSRFHLGARPSVMAVVADLSARRRAEADAAAARAKAARSEALHRQLLESLPVGVFRSSPDGLLLYANAALSRILGYDDPQQMRGLDLARDVYDQPGDRDRLLRSLHERDQWHGVELRLRRADGRRTLCRIAAHKVRGVGGRLLWYEGTVEDVSQRKRIEVELERVRRMETTTRLAGGLTHTLSNLLTSVVGNVQLARMAVETGVGDALRDLDEAETGLWAAADVLARLRSFTSSTQLQARATNLAQFLREWAEERPLPDSIQLEMELDDDLPEVQVDPEALEQILRELVANSLEAMPAGGRIGVSLRRDRRDEGFVQLSVRDTGEGMSEQVRERAVEPFFSTRERRKTALGAGLGLSLAYGLARQHGGDLSLTSQPGAGAEVRVRFPAAGPRGSSEGSTAA